MQLDDVLKNPALISVNSRTLKPGEIYVALEGPKYDGHDFVKSAFRKGAAACIVSKKRAPGLKTKKPLIKVSDTLKVLGYLARVHRAKFNIPIIGVTGSNGKTTTKEMVAHILSSRYKVLKNESSFNNLVGLPLTLFRLNNTHEAAVLEMGTTGAGEIARLCRIAAPNIGIITNIGPSHLEFFKTLDGVFRAKSELIYALGRRGLAVLNRDEACLGGIKGFKGKKIYYGINKDCRFRARGVLYKNGKHFFYLNKKRRFELAIHGRHNVYNALAAIAVGDIFNIGFAEIARRVKGFKLRCPMRLSRKNIRGIKILDDSYNSNPSSMRCAVGALADEEARGRRIVVSGDMLELGRASKAMHRQLARVIAQKGIDCLVTVGRMSRFTHDAAKTEGVETVFHADSPRLAARFLKNKAKKGDVVLVKGSRGMKMEEIIEILRR